MYQQLIKIDYNFGNLKFETPKPLFGVNKALIRRKKQKKTLHYLGDTINF